MKKEIQVKSIIIGKKRKIKRKNSFWDKWIDPFNKE